MGVAAIAVGVAVFALAVFMLWPVTPKVECPLCKEEFDNPAQLRLHNLILTHGDDIR